MKTTEVFVEQVLIGFVFLITCALPFGLVDGTLLAWGDLRLVNGLVFIGIAYLVGIPADRIVDTLLSGLDQRNRGRFALKNPVEGEDPFPEDLLKISVMKKGGAAWELLNYLRSRIRLARALTAFAPALTVSAVLAVWHRDATARNEDLPGWALGVGLGGTFLIYLLALWWVAAKQLPKTKDLLPETEVEIDRLMKDLVWWRDPVCRLLPIVVMLAAGLGVASGSIEAVPVGLAGLLLTLASGWTAWRVTRTFMRFLYDFDRHERDAGAAPRTGPESEPPQTP